MKIKQTLQRRLDRQFEQIPIEELLRFLFRLTLAVTGSVLLFIAAIYYGVINP